jgi:hypothetical protein
MLFYGMTPTDRLLRVHADMARIYRRWSPTITTRTRPGVWVPHCTLATQVDAGRLSDAITTAGTLVLPRVATRVRLAIVQFDQGRVELLRVFPCQGSPACRNTSPIRRFGSGLSGITDA